MIGSGPLASIGGEIIVIVAIALLLYIVYKIGKSLLKVILGIIINSVLGIAVIWIVDTFLGIGIPFAVYTLIPTALFGLPAAGTLIILRFFGIPL
jgi:hypothetical protein